MDYTQIQQAVYEAARERELAEAAESARRTMRLCSTPKWYEKRLWFKVKEQAFTPDQVNVLYDALGVVKKNHLARAAEIEKSISQGS